VEAGEQVTARPGLRERKKQQTRDKIARAGLDLFAERGYDQTTLADIADAADVSARTIFAYFESKEDILFCDEPDFHDGLKRALEERPAGTTTVDALRTFIFTLHDGEDNDLKLRKQIVSGSESLRLAERARFARVEDLIAASIARDLDAKPGDLRPALVAASMTAAFTTMRDRLESESDEPLSYDQAMEMVDQVLDFVRSGLDGLRPA
jgi:AcrR family transcriptional regulator